MKIINLDFTRKIIANELRKTFCLKTFIILSFLLMTIINTGCDKNVDDDHAISENITQLTSSQNGASSQNPAFSPDGNYILFTRFINGYNKPPSEIVKINIATRVETIIIPAQSGAEHISVPGSAWVNGKICWSSDMAGASNEIYIANDDGTEIEQIRSHLESEGYYIEPVFNPLNTDKIIFEFGASDNDPHQIAIVELDKSNKVTFLTSNADFDDRLPNWSPDGQKILFQRSSAKADEWRINTADIDFSGTDPRLANESQIEQPDNSNCDNSWYFNGNYVLSSTEYNSEMPNIFAISINGGNPERITLSKTDEHGAPSSSPNGKLIAFESHEGEDEEYPSEIWIIEIPDALE